MHIIHYKSSGLTGTEASKPSSDLAYGEVAVNYRKDNETLFFKNKGNSLVKILSDTVNKRKFLQEDNSYFRIFATAEEYLEAQQNGDITYPSVSYITQTNEIKIAVSSKPYHFRFEANYLDTLAYLGDGIEEYFDIFKQSGYIPLSLMSEQFESFIVNGVEMIDSAGPWEEVYDGMYSSIIKVPYEKDGVWDVQVKFAEYGFTLTEENVFSYVYQLFTVPLTEIVIDSILKDTIIIADTLSTTTFDWFGGAFAIVKKVTFTGDFMDLVSFIMNGLYLYTKINDDGIRNILLNFTPPVYYIPSNNTTYGNRNDFIDVAELNVDDLHIPSNTVTFWAVVNGINKKLEDIKHPYRIEVIEY